MMKLGSSRRTGRDRWWMPIAALATWACVLLTTGGWDRPGVPSWLTLTATAFPLAALAWDPA